MSSTVLVATSDASAREVLTQAVTLSRVSVVHAADGIETLAIARKRELDLAILDNFLAVLDGPSTCARIRNLDMPRHPVILVAGVTNERMAESAFEAGADEVLRKPLQASIIRQRVAGLLERRRIEDRLRLLERSLERAVSGITILDGRTPDYPVQYVNATFAEMTGYAKDELIGRNLRLLAGPESDVAVLAEMREALSHGRPCRAVLKNYRKDGTTFWNELSLAPVRDEKGLLEHWIGIQTDASVRLRVGELALAQQELEEQVEQHTRDLEQALARLDERRRFTETILNALTAGVITTDARGTLSFVNWAALEMLQLGLSDCLGRPAQDVLGESQELETALTEPGAETRRLECEIQSPSGATPRVALSVVPGPGDGREGLGHVLVLELAAPTVAAPVEEPRPEPTVVPPFSLLRQALASVQSRGEGAVRRPLVENPLQELPAVEVDEGPVVNALSRLLEAGLALVGDEGRVRVRLHCEPVGSSETPASHAGLAIELSGELATEAGPGQESAWPPPAVESQLDAAGRSLESSGGRLEIRREPEDQWHFLVQLPIAEPDAE